MQIDLRSVKYPLLSFQFFFFLPLFSCLQQQAAGGSDVGSGSDASVGDSGVIERSKYAR